MLYGPSLEELERSSRMAEPVYRCDFCDRLYDQETVGRMDDEKLPCPCGVQIQDLRTVYEVDDPSLQFRDESLTLWDEVVILCADSGFWRCEVCGFTAKEEDWINDRYGDETISTCPLCGGVENIEEMRIKR